MHDIHALSVCWTDDVFTEALRLFFLKWEASGDKTVLPVLKHFRKVWTNNGVSLWASGHAHNCVVNNNGLESTNGKIKDLVTQRHLMRILDFLRAIMGLITSKSVILDSTNVNYIHSSPFYPLNTDSESALKPHHRLYLLGVEV